ncbi:hypothetical protein BG006_007480, partial [Podila minutissima]
TIAILLVGNSGAGKSTLLNQLRLDDEEFASGSSFRKGYTKQVDEEEVESNGQRVLLIDMPGLYEPSDTKTQENAKKLTTALPRGYDYKVHFVLKASNRHFNQIMVQEVYDMYQNNLAHDSFMSFFGTLQIPGFSFAITIDHVLLLNFSKETVNAREFAKEIADDVGHHTQSPIKLDRKLKLSNEDITLFEAAVMTLTLGTPVAIARGVAGLAVGCAAAATGVAVGELAAFTVGVYLCGLYTKLAR